MIVDTEKVSREADGPGEHNMCWGPLGWKGDRPGVRLKERTVRADEEPEDHKRIP